MPPWVARRCRVSRASHCAAIGALLRPLLHPRLACAAPLRSHALHTKHDRLPTSQYINSAIIVPRSVASTRPEDLIEHISPVDPPRLFRDRFAVFLVTPRFATWLLDDHVFLQKALRKAYSNVFKSDKIILHRIHALCAVVDKLPTPRPISSQELPEDATQGRTKNPPVTDIGHEGLAYAVLSASDSVPISSSAPEGKGVISFFASKNSGKEGIFSDTVQVPLANTVFQTGLPTTMTLSTWVFRRSTDDITLKSKENISQHGIRLHGSTPFRRAMTALSIPLVPLTVPRRVHASMGNILRQVIGAKGKPVAASQELETAIPQFFQSRGEPSQAISVWALMIPKDVLPLVLEETKQLLDSVRINSGDQDLTSAAETAIWKALWASEPPVWSEIIQSALSHGARLHRVLSGGGGWGKKAGLLSLDPDAGYSDPISSSTGFDADEGPAELSSALQQVAHNDGSIQFFISPSTAKQDVEDPERYIDGLRDLEHDLKHDGTPWQWEFGTIPSTVDVMHENSWQYKTSGANEVLAFKLGFGALSEGALSLQRQLKLAPDDSISAIGGTKIDVPFSRFSMQNHVRMKNRDIDEESMPKYTQANDDSLAGKMYSGAATTLLKGVSTRKFSTSTKPCVTPPDEPHPLIRKGRTRIKDSTKQRSVHPLDEPYPLIRKCRTRIKDSTKQRSVHPLDEPYPMIRKYSTFITELSKVLEKSRPITKSVEKLTAESRMIMRKIRRRSQLLKHIRARYLSTEYYFSELRMGKNNDLSEVILDVLLPAEVKQTTAEIHRLQHEALSIITTVKLIQAYKLLDRRVNRIRRIIRSLHTEFTKTLIHISLRADITNAANNSAIDIYNLHIAFRWQLAAMIAARQSHSLPHPLAKGIPRLETQLVKLRVFSTNLFPNKGDLSAVDIRRSLHQRERQNKVSLVALSPIAQWKQKIISLSPSEQLRNRHSAQLRRTRKSPYLPQNHKIRKELVRSRLRYIKSDKEWNPSPPIRAVVGAKQEAILSGREAVVPEFRIRLYSHGNRSKRLRKDILRTNMAHWVRLEKEKRFLGQISGWIGNGGNKV